MTYGQPEKDLVYAIEDDKYFAIADKIRIALSDTDIELSFKDNKPDAFKIEIHSAVFCLICAQTFPKLLFSTDNKF